jgi:hypothetical protein
LGRETVFSTVVPWFVNRNQGQKMNDDVPPPSPKHTQASPGVTEYVRNELLKDYSKSIGSFYLHLYQSTATAFQFGYEDAVPISREYRRKHFRTSVDKYETNLLRQAGILRMTDYDIPTKKSKRYRIPNKILLKLAKLDLEELNTGLRCKLKSQSKINKFNKKPKLTSTASSFVKKAINSIHGGLMNHSEALQQIGDQLENFEIMPNQKKFIAKCIHDIHNLAKASSNGIIVNGILEYNQIYKPGTTGRIFESGGFQSLSKETKKAGMMNIDNVCNYDIRSSQIAALCQEAEKIGIDTSILRNYINNPKAKIDYAIKSGFVDQNDDVISTVWKKCLMSLVFGSSMAKYYGAPYDIIEEFDENRVKDLFPLFQKAVSPFLQLRNEWYDNLDRYMEIHSRNHKHGRFYTNASGMKINLSKDDIGKCKKKLSAFILQGLESGFIHHLTIIAKDYDYRVLSNEHDGLVTIGKIPDEAIQIAKGRSGFELAKLEIKEF